MPTPAMSTIAEPRIEALLGDELAAADRALAGIPAVLGHLLGSEDQALFSDRLVARVRAQLHDLASQLLVELGEAGDDGADPLAAALAAHPLLLAHAHALALEAELAERLAAQAALDPVLSPLLQALIASPDPETAAAAMSLLAAQARFGQAQRRGELPLTELPGDLLHAVLVTTRTWVGSDRARDARAAEAERAIRGRFDESASRLGLLQRLVAGMGAAAGAALDLAHGGVALFVTALALAAGLDRDVAVLSTGRAQLPRLALALAACGLKPAQIEQQVLALHPDAALPDGFASLGAERAAALLAGAGALGAG